MTLAFFLNMKLIAYKATGLDLDVLFCQSTFRKVVL